MSQQSWYGVRCLFRHRALEVYEERITVWVAGSLDEAIGRAEEEAAEYCEDLDGVEYVRFAEACAMDGSPDDGAEIFSLMRESSLAPPAYVRSFHATGAERTAWLT
ncbi:hypothetical protein [Streptomyces sp. YIM S03343]